MKKNLFEQFYTIARKDFDSDSKLAEALGITRSSFAQYTRKKKPVSPGLSKIEDWCLLLEITYSDNVFKKI